MASTMPTAMPMPVRRDFDPPPTPAPGTGPGFAAGFAPNGFDSAAVAVTGARRIGLPADGIQEQLQALR